MNDKQSRIKLLTVNLNILLTIQGNVENVPLSHSMPFKRLTNFSDNTSKIYTFIQPPTFIVYLVKHFTLQFIRATAYIPS